MDDRSEVSAVDLGGAGLDLSLADMHDSSHSSSMLDVWPETHANTVRFMKDAELDMKKFQLERHANELEGTILDREIELQSEIREINSIISSLQLSVAEQEQALSQTKESRNGEILRIRSDLVNRLREQERVMLDSEPTITQLVEAIDAQREGQQHEQAVAQNEFEDEMAALDAQIASITAEMDKARQRMFDIQQKSEADTSDTRATMEMLENEIASVGQDCGAVDAQFDRVNGDLTLLRRQLIIAEEESDALRTRLAAQDAVRARMRVVLGRGRNQLWETQTKSFGEI